MAIAKDFHDMELEFRAINSELEAKSVELMKRADDVVKNQEKSMYDFIKADYELDKLSNNYFSNGNTSKDNLESSTLQHYWKSSDTENVAAKKQNGDSNVANPVKHLLEIKDKIKNANSLPNGHLNRANSLSDMTELFKKQESLDCGNLDDFDQEVNIENNFETMMKAFDSQKEFSKTIDGLLKTKNAVRNKSGLPFSKMNLPRDKPKTKFIDKDLMDLDAISLPKTTAAEDAILKAYKSKIRILEGDLQKCQETLTKRSSELMDFTKRNQILEEGKIKTISQLNTLKANSVRMEAKIAALQSKIQVKEAECRALRSERDSISRSAKEAVQGSSGTEVRLSRAREEITSLREQLSKQQAIEKEMKDEAKKQVDELTASLGRSEKAKLAAVKAVRKQAMLVDNLRRQVGLLEAGQRARGVGQQMDNLING